MSSRRVIHEGKRLEKEKIREKSNQLQKGPCGDSAKTADDGRDYA
jgi:hypothetical protein